MSTTRQPGRRRLGRIARTRPRDRSREMEARDPLDVDLPDPASEPVTSEPLAERARRELDPEVLRSDEDAAAEETSPQEEVEKTDAEDAAPRSGAYRAGRRALMLACWSVLGFALVIVVAVALPNAFGLRDLTVLSGSMEPTFSTGDVVVERQISPLDARLGDIVSFVTKGDANTGVEHWNVSADGTLGKVEYHVWRLGYLLSFIREPFGRIVLIVAPALLLGAYELVRIWRPKPGAVPEESDASDDPDYEAPADAEESEADEAQA